MLNAVVPSFPAYQHPNSPNNPPVPCTLQPSVCLFWSLYKVLDATRGEEIQTALTSESRVSLHHCIRSFEAGRRSSLNRWKRLEIAARAMQLILHGRSGVPRESTTQVWTLRADLLGHQAWFFSSLVDVRFLRRVQYPPNHQSCVCWSRSTSQISLNIDIATAQTCLSFPSLRSPSVLSCGMIK